LYGISLLIFLSADYKCMVFLIVPV